VVVNGLAGAPIRLATLAQGRLFDSAQSDGGKRKSQIAKYAKCVRKGREAKLGRMDEILRNRGEGDSEKGC
jgi:hypothetical protein